MFEFFRKPQPRHASAALAQALTSQGLPPGMQASSLSVVEQRGSYSGRHVSYFRVFDPVRVAERNVVIRVFADLDAHPDLVLGSGHLEHDGSVVLSHQHGPPTPTSAYVRTDADRSQGQHGDDERLVFPDRAS